MKRKRFVVVMVCLLVTIALAGFISCKLSSSPCPKCDGTGVCSTCIGTGNGDSDGYGGHHPCGACKGSKKCDVCKGEGKIHN